MCADTRTRRQENGPPRPGSSPECHLIHDVMSSPTVFRSHQRDQIKARHRFNHVSTLFQTPAQRRPYDKVL